MNSRYPVSAWFEVDPANLDEDYIVDLITRRQKAIIAEIEIFDFELSDPEWPDPYLSIAKCEEIEPPKDRFKPWRDNGRLLRAGHVKTWITDVDLRIILETYDGHIQFNKAYYARYGNLPRRFIEVVNSYYQAKTKLKGIEGADIEYLEAKKKNNGIYGMEATDPIKPKFTYDGITVSLPVLTDEVVGELYDEYTKKAWIPYAWGVWTTAWGRYDLYKGMSAICDDPNGGGCLDMVYWDTDSLKYTGDHDKALEALNREYKRRSKSNEGCARDSKGKMHYLGIFEQERPYKRFITYGAKKYAYEYDEGEGRVSVHTTIAGVDRKKGAAELVRAGGLEALIEGFTFREAGGTESWYNDIVPDQYKYIEREGRQLHLTKNIAIAPSTYTLGITAEYEALLEDADLWRAMLDDKAIYRYTKKRTVKS